MSEFKCPVVKVASVTRHPNADTLCLITFEGMDYTCITSDIAPGVERYRVGDPVVYVPEQAVMPDYLLKKLGFWDEVNGCGTLSGSRKNRVKIIKLRQIFSQGLMIPVDVLPYNPDMCLTNDKEQKLFVTFGDDCAEFLGITKYEPAIPSQMRGVMGALFGYTKSYDIESLNNYPNTFEDGEEVVVTEKLHGTQVSFGFLMNPPEGKDDALIDVDGKKCAYVSSKGLSKQGFVQAYTEQNQDNIYVKMYNKYMAEVAGRIVTDQVAQKMARVIIYGEIFGPGVQSGFTYNQKQPTFRLFDVWVEFTDEHGLHQVYLDDDLLDAFCKVYFLDRVPVLYRGPYSKEKMIELRDGQSTLGGNIKEGIVVRSARENYEARGLCENRKQVKFVSPAYLMKSTGEEIQ